MGKKKHSELLPILRKACETVKESDTYKELCKEYGVDEDIIFLIPMAFADLDVSARTDRGCIYFNNRLIDDFPNNYHYLAHELTHVFQQCWGDKPTQGALNSEDYLNNKYEQDGFKTQTKYIAETEGEPEAEEYIDKVLEHHDVSDNDKPETRKKLLARLAQKNCPKVTDHNVKEPNNWEGKIKLPVPLLHQASHFSCGAAATLATLLYWFSDKIPFETEIDLWKKLGTSEKDGTHPDKIVDLFKSEGLRAKLNKEMSIDDVKQAIDNHETVIMAFQAWPGKSIKSWGATWANGHYSIAVGYDEENIYLMDPSTHGSYTWIPAKELAERWHDIDNGHKIGGIGIIVSGKKPRQQYPDDIKRLCRKELLANLTKKAIY